MILDWKRRERRLPKSLLGMKRVCYIFFRVFCYISFFFVLSLFLLWIFSSFWCQFMNFLECILYNDGYIGLGCLIMAVMGNHLNYWTLCLHEILTRLVHVHLKAVLVCISRSFDKLNHNWSHTIFGHWWNSNSVLEFQVEINFHFEAKYLISTTTWLMYPTFSL